MNINISELRTYFQEQLKRFKIPEILKRRPILLAIGAFLVGVLFLWSFYFMPLKATPQQEITFVVEKGRRSSQIAKDLQEAGLVRSSVVFQIYVAATGNIRHLEAGTYFLSPTMSLPTIAKKIAIGDIVSEEITILEGWSLKNIAEEFEGQGLFSQEEFFEVTGTPGIDLRHDKEALAGIDFSKEFEFLLEKPEYVSLEGFLFPDTYQITRDDTPEDVVRRMLRRFGEQTAGNLKERIGNQEKSFFELLTMASIIEKEVRSLQDKKTVSGILWKRLANSVRLQVDATVVYVREGNYKIVSIDETKTESSYNTYIVDGLPLGPISNPGLESIVAALEPTESPYWYYLNPSINTTIFSKTFEEHKANKAMYLQ